MLYILFQSSVSFGLMKTTKAKWTFVGGKVGTRHTYYFLNYDNWLRWLKGTSFQFLCNSYSDRGAWMSDFFSGNFPLEITLTTLATQSKLRAYSLHFKAIILIRRFMADFCLHILPFQSLDSGKNETLAAENRTFSFLNLVIILHKYIWRKTNFPLIFCLSGHQ